MKIFESPQRDLEKNFSKLETIQKQLRDLRDDNQIMNKKLDTCVKALAAIYSAPNSKDTETDEVPEPWVED